MNAPSRSSLAARGLVRLSLLAAALAVSAGCKKEPPAPTTWKEPAAPTARPTPPAGAVTPPAPTAAATEPRGTVVETMDSGGYTYARLDVAGAQVWVAGPETKLAVGAQVSLGGGTPMANFHSNTLDRTFDQIYFLGSLGDAPSAASAGSAAGAATGSPHAMAPTATAVTPGAKIEPVAGGQSVEQVFAATAKLAGKPVAVRGRVVKYNAGIMGKNWLHLQDGSGAAGTNDLTVTTMGTAAIGDVVVARGVLAVDKDFGAGYKYPVLVEDATLSAK